jgi:RNA polymerase sigma-70 factor (ECF subfamily)
MTDLDDAALFDRYLRERDRGALAALFERYARRLYGLALTILRDPAAAEDAAQQVFLRLLDARSGPEEGHFRAWIYRIAYNEAVQALRQRRRRQQREQERMREPQPAGASNDALRLELEEGLAELDPALQEVLRLRYQHGLAFHEVARVLDRPQGTVARQAHEAREQLRRRLVATGLLAGLSLETTLEAMELPALPEQFVRRVLARTGGRPALLSKLPAGLAVLVPVVAALLLTSALRSRASAPPPVTLAEPRTADAGPTPAPAGSLAPATPDLFGSDQGAEGTLRVLEARFRIVLVPPGRATTRIELREVIDLETTAHGRTRESARPETPGSTDVYVATVRCPGPSVFEITAYHAGKDGEYAAWPPRRLTVSPGDNLEVRLVQGERGYSSFRDLLLPELPGQKHYGAVRGRFVGAQRGWRVTFADADPSWKDRTWVEDEGDEGFIIIPAPPGARELRISDRCCSATYPVQVKAGEIVDLGTLVHTKRGVGVVRGRVIDAQGRPAAGANVALWEDCRADDRRHLSTVTDRDGRFEFAGLDESMRAPEITVIARELQVEIERRPVRVGDMELLLRLPERTPPEVNR